jgi:hypothetical protein
MDTPSTPTGTEAQPTQDVEGFLSKYVSLTEEGGELDGKVGTKPAVEGDEVDEDEEEILDTETPDEEEDAADEAESDDEAEDDEATDEGEDEQPELIPVKIDGKIEQVSLDELKKGYSRTKVFTQRTQEVAEKRKALEAREAELTAERTQLAAAIEQLNEQLTAIDPEPDWDALAAEDREEYVFQKAIWADKRAKREKLSQVRAEMERRNTEANQQALAVKLESERDALLDKVPAWKDDAKAKKELADIRQYVLDRGFSEAEANAVYDHRLLLVLRDGYRYRRLTANKDKVALPDKPGAATKIKEGPKTLTPGRSSKIKPGAREKREAAMDRLKQSGRTDDAAEFFKTLPGLID